MADIFADLDAQVRRVDQDRWLASRFAPKEARQRLVALYALDHEIARTAAVVSEPGIGAIRLAWWRDACSDLAAGRGDARHPVLAALSSTGVGWAPSMPETLQALIEAHADALAGEALNPDASAGGVMRLALAACGVSSGEQTQRFIAAAAPAWSWLQAAAAATDCEHGPLSPALSTAYVEARALARALPAEAFPAVGYIALLGLYARSRQPPLFLRQLRLIAASATGRF